MAVAILIMFFWVKPPCGFVIEIDVSENLAVSIFSPEDGHQQKCFV
jgi:hypothetical protein